MSKNNSKQLIVFLGPPGSGKGTQAEILQDKFGFSIIGGGEICRREAQKNTKQGRMINRLIDNGKLIPNKLMAKLVEKEIKNHNSNKIILDGFPRSKAQLKFFKNRINKAIYLDLKEKEIIRRLSNRVQCPKCKEIYNLATEKPKNGKKCDNCNARLEQRDDDKPKAIKERIREFKKETRPLINCFRQKKILEKIDASKSIEEIARMISKKLNLQ